MRVLGLIPARGGSKGVPRKNVRLLDGKPLLQYTAEAALAAKRLSRIILSTDDLEIAEVGRKCGLEVPFIRPSNLAEDHTPMLPVIQHAIRFVEEYDDFFDAICLLQPPNPLRAPADIDGCIMMLEQNQADAVFTVLDVPELYNPHWVFTQNQDGSLKIVTGETQPIPRRQELPAAFYRDGSVYVSRRDVIINQNSLYGTKYFGYPMDPDRSINIDAIEDWLSAEKKIQEINRRN